MACNFFTTITKNDDAWLRTFYRLLTEVVLRYLHIRFLCTSEVYYEMLDWYHRMERNFVFVLFFVSLFVWGLSSYSRVFISNGDVYITGEELYFWPMLGTHDHWGFLSVLHFRDTGHPLYNGHLRRPVTLTPIAKRWAVKLSLPGFLRIRSFAAGIRTPNLQLAQPIAPSRWSGVSI